ncbi:hypothetical protein ACFVS2_26080 [Brevibacillus sp. NPDC058079]|uniref:hypothetical protein n=1 Tax=Brevibacillus sp. NPDC058079 TaxID=3346330 RepID=UPI0036EA0547
MESGLVKMPYAIWTNTHSDDDYEVFYKGDIVKYTFREKDVLLEAIEEHDSSCWILKHHEFERDLRPHVANKI